MTRKTVTREDLTEAVQRIIGLSLGEARTLVSQVLKTIATHVGARRNCEVEFFRFVRGTPKGRAPRPQSENPGAGNDTAAPRSGVQAVSHPQAADKFAAWAHIGPRDREKPGRAEALRAGAPPPQALRGDSAVAVDPSRGSSARVKAYQAPRMPAAFSESVCGIRLAGWDKDSFGWRCHPCLIVIEHEQPYSR